MTGVGLADGHHGEPVAAALGRQIEVHDLRVLFLQDGHEHLVERHAQHGGLVRRLAGVGGVVDRLLAMGDALDLEYRKPVLFVVIAGVVAERAFERVEIAVFLHQRRAGFALTLPPGWSGRQMAFEPDFRRGGNL